MREDRRGDDERKRDEKERIEIEEVVGIDALIKCYVRISTINTLCCCL